MEEGIRVMGVWPVACAARYAPDRVIPGRELCDLLGAGAHFGAGVAVFVTTTWFSRESGKCVVQNDIVGVHRDHFGVRNNGMPLVFVGAVNGRGQGDVRFRARFQRA